MTANVSPIFSKLGDVQLGVVLSATATTDYAGQNVNNAIVFTSDSTNGGYLQRLRFKALGSNASATVARIYINNGSGRLVYASTGATASTGITGTASNSGGALVQGNYFAKVVAVDGYGGFSVASVESAAAAVTSGLAGSVSWAFATVNSAVSYMIFVGPVTGGQTTWFSCTGTPFVQTMMVGNRDSINGAITATTLYGEIALPVTTAIATTSTVDVDYPMNIALPPGYRVIAGLGTAAAAGWAVSAIGGKY